ncbi:MAG: hypothetical protein ACTS73_05195 [Arsenophonus sp. NEOnobi-MAG3]
MAAHIIGVTEHGRNELVAIEDIYRESEVKWAKLFNDLQKRVA